MEIGNSDQLLLTDFRGCHWDPEVLHKLVDQLGRSFIVVFLYRVTDIVKDTQLELTLHLCDCELLVHPFLFGSHQNFRDLNVQEAGR